MGMRKPAVAGAFYPADKKELREMILGFIRYSRTVCIQGELKALIVPHAGYIYSGVVAAAGYKLLKDSKYKKFLILGPSHYVPFMGASFSFDDYWSTPLGKVPVIKPEETENLKSVPEAHIQEHSIETQLPFLQVVVKQFGILPLILGYVNPKSLAKELINYLDDETFIIISSDLSHYHTYEEARNIDSFSNKVIPSLDTNNAERIDACGSSGIQTVLHIAKQLGWKGVLIDYKNSGDTAGDKNHVVGYGCYGFYSETKRKG
ncbi:MAG: AmmeMemoRadiSam system protein B [Candidatus Aenigmatarchaeota archaeon]|nr:AmmeMemoRadiSam system protein B [Nanoarchaeota archaeon]